MTRRKGDLSELRATIWLWEQGWEVYKNVSAVGVADLIAVDPDGVFHRIDVKTVSYQPPRANGKRGKTFNPLTQAQQALGVSVVYVDGDVVYWGHDRNIHSV